MRATGQAQRALRAARPFFSSKSAAGVLPLTTSSLPLSPSPAPTLSQSTPSKPRLHSTFPASSSSVNATELSHFSSLASSWWDPHGPSRPLHQMNPLRHDFIRLCLGPSYPSPSSGPTLRYLDVGCGGGIFAESAARLPTTREVTAIDPSETILEVARQHMRGDPGLKGKLRYLNRSIETLEVPGDKDKYDVVSLFEVLEHVDHPKEFLRRLSQFVRPDGGWLVMSTIARTWISWIVTNVVAEDILGVVPKGTHDWNKYVNVEELRELFKSEGGWSEPRVMGVVYVPGCGWKVVEGSEKIGNYFFGVQRLD